MRKVLIMLLLPFFSLITLYGQTEKLCGIILDKTDGMPVPRATIRLTDIQGRLLNYTFAAEDGSFTIKYDHSQTELTVHVQSMGYRSQNFVLKPSMSPVTIRLQAEPTRLRDVIVKAPDIEQRSDTLVYYTSKYARKQDRNIGDVLKRLPGIEVEDNGTIKYNGEPINKFYINGSDFADGRYNLATENISPSDVASVEVMENHQPIRVLQGLDFSQQAGLNIKLREEARQRWVGIANGGIGAAPLLYDASLFAMRIAGKWQNMESVRVNDTGWNPASQSTRHTEDQVFGSSYQNDMWQDGISLTPASAPLDERRTRDNLSVLANTTNSWHVGEDYDVKLNVTYSGDRLDYNTGYRTDYLDSNIPSFTQLNTMRTHSNTVNGQWALQTNRPTLYFKENLYIDADWYRALSQIDGTSSLAQQAETSSLAITNDLQMLKRIGKRLLTVSSRNRYMRTPQWLNVRATETEKTQQLLSNDFRTVTELRYGWISGKWNIYARGGVDYNLHCLETNLTGVNIDYPINGNNDFSLLNIYLSPEISYQSIRWLLTISSPVSYRRYVTDNYLSVTPTIFTRYQLNAKTDLSAQLKYALLPTEPSQYIGHVIMSDYRNLYAGYPVRSYAQERSATVAARYRNPISSFFANLSARYGWDYNPSIANQLFIGDQVLSTYAPAGNDAHQIQVYGGLSKGLRSGRIVLGADVRYMQLHTTTMRQNVQSPYTIRYCYVRPSMKGNFTRWLSSDYSLSYTYNTMNINNAERSTYHILKQNLTFTFIPGSNWQIAVGGEHYYTRFDSGDRTHLLLLDASVRWRISKKIEWSVMATNLLNEKKFNYMVYGLLNQTKYTYDIRGCNVLFNIQIQL